MPYKVTPPPAPKNLRRPAPTSFNNPPAVNQLRWSPAGGRQARGSLGGQQFGGPNFANVLLFERRRQSTSSCRSRSKRDMVQQQQQACAAEYASLGITVAAKGPEVLALCLLNGGWHTPRCVNHPVTLAALAAHMGERLLRRPVTFPGASSSRSRLRALVTPTERRLPATDAGGPPSLAGALGSNLAQAAGLAAVRSQAR